MRLDLRESRVGSEISQFELAPKHTDGLSDTKESKWTNSNWGKQWARFNQNPELKSSILQRASWIIGKGWRTDNKRTEAILKRIRGNGKESFDDIMFNVLVNSRIGGDGYAQIRNDDRGDLLNLIVLDPGTISIIYNRQGRIIRYEQASKNPKVIKTFPPEEIFHLAHNRLADQLHGISDVDIMEDILDADTESFEDVRRISHSGAVPIILWKLKTADERLITDFKAKIKIARELSTANDLFIPDDENIVSHEIIQTDFSPNIFRWRDDIRNGFYRNIGLPQIATGAGGHSTESESKAIYLFFEQLVEMPQRKLERDILNQLSLKIDLIPPTTLSAQLQGDEAKDAQGALRTQPNDVQAGVGR